MIKTLHFSKSKMRQQGFLMIDILLAMTAIMVILTMWARWQNTEYLESQATTARQRVQYIINKSQQYYMSKVIVDGNATTDTDNYPSSYSDLTDNDYIDACSSSDELANECVDYSTLPIADGEEVGFNVTTDDDGWPELELSFDLSGENDTKKENLIIKEMAQIPGYSMASSEITITISRPGTALAYDALVHTDGSTPMEEDWDYGGVVLDNVADMSITDITDRTLVTSMLKNGSEYIDDSSGITVSKQDCPDGYDATISTYFIGTGGDTQYAEVSNIDTWWESNGSSSWTIYARFIGRETTDDELSFIYQGNVGYFTWCDL